MRAASISQANRKHRPIKTVTRTLKSKDTLLGRSLMKPIFSVIVKDDSPTDHNTLDGIYLDDLDAQGIPHETSLPVSESSYNQNSEIADDDFLQSFYAGKVQVVGVPPEFGNGPSYTELTQFPDHPDDFNAQYFKLDQGITCRAWQATASEVSYNMKIDFAQSPSGPRITPPPYSVRDLVTGHLVPEEEGMFMVYPETMRYALTLPGDKTRHMGEISFLYPQIWSYSERLPHPTHNA